MTIFHQVTTTQVALNKQLTYEFFVIKCWNGLNAGCNDQLHTDSCSKASSPQAIRNESSTYISKQKRHENCAQSSFSATESIQNLTNFKNRKPPKLKFWHICNCSVCEVVRCPPSDNTCVQNVNVKIYK